MTLFPEDIDNFTTLPIVIDGVSPVRAENFNSLRTAIVAIQQELGINPSSIYATIGDRLASITNSDGYGLGSLFVNKGDLLGFDGESLAILSPSGNDGYVLTEDSSEEIGFKWAVSSGGEGGGVTDHGDLIGLNDNDHPQYQLLTGKNAISGYAGLDSSSLLTAAQLPDFTTSVKGAVPASGGGTANFIRADGTWAAPTGTNIGSGASGRLTFWSGTNTLSSASTLLWDGTTLTTNGLSITGNVTIGDATGDTVTVNSSNWTFNNATAFTLATSGTTFTLNAESVVDGDNRTVAEYVDTRAMAAGVGAGISLAGKYTTGGTVAGFGGIRAMKVNSTTANTAASIAFLARPAGGGVTEYMRLMHDGKFGIGLTNPSTALHVVGQIKASTGFDASDGYIVNVLDPVSNQNAATKKYVDDQKQQ